MFESGAHRFAPFSEEERDAIQDGLMGERHFDEADQEPELARRMEVANVLLQELASPRIGRSDKEIEEENRLVKILLQRAWPQIDMRGTIEFFGLEGEDVGDDTAMRRMSRALDRICERVGFDRPPPSMGPRPGPRKTGGGA